ncbi:MAG: penicillin-binding transpeptidase domain-containing protein [Candidatus Limivicinus sp.]|nr:penicillin-binding transpeptidase domain-containing protein [Candidatus Limivicinus sp.]
MSKEKSGAPVRTGPGRQMLRRAIVLASVFGIASFAVLLARLYKLQIKDHQFYERLAIEQQLRSTPSSAERGVIYDTNMNVLAVSASVDNVYLSPAEIESYGEDRELIALGLSEILGLEYDEVYEKSGRTGSWYVTVARKIEREKADEVRRFKSENGLRGVRLETDTKRYYPNSTLACHVIGFVGTDNYGLEGIEARYDSALSGTAGRTVRATNAYGTEMLFTQFEEYCPGEDGFDIVTTLDSTIQYYVEKHLRQAVEDYDIQNGAGAIAMDVNTGKVLAMASLGNYDLNNFLSVSDRDRERIAEAGSREEAAQLLAEAQAKQWRNKALSDTYEPGSTFKIITLAMALEEGAVSLDDMFYCGGNVSVLGRTNPIRCWKTTGHGSQTLTQAAQHSCNVAFVNIGQRVGAERFYDYCEAFGFLKQSADPDENLTATTGIDLSGESGSIWWSKNTFCSEKNLSQLAAASFGQTFTITPLQLVCAVSACVNGGYLMEPYVVQRMLNPDGSVAYEREPHVVRQAISASTSEKLRGILEQVVGDSKEGTGRNAAVAGYRIGGKTGTSEKVSLEAQTGQKEYIVSFIGFAPADEPRIALLVFLDTPSNKSGIYISGGQMAAPVVGRMMADILPYMGVKAESGEENGEAVMPMTVGKSLGEAAEMLGDAGLRYRTIGGGITVTQQLPAAGSSIAAGSQVILYLDAEISQDTETVPDLTGMTYNQARDTLSYYGIYISTRSNVTDSAAQTVSGQSLPAGTGVDHGCIIEVSLIDQDDSILGRY